MISTFILGVDHYVSLMQNVRVIFDHQDCIAIELDVRHIHASVAHMCLAMCVILHFIFLSNYVYCELYSVNL